MDHFRLDPLLGRTDALIADEDGTTELRHHRLPILEKELHRLEFEISLLFAKRARLVNQIDRCRIAVAPHKCLPPELIGQIFLRCVEGPAVLPLADGKNDTRLVITQICSAWRSIAFNVAELWDVDFDFLDSTRLLPESLGCVDLVTSWLSQCHSTSLSLRVYSDKGSRCATDHANRLDHIVNSVVIPNAHRFNSLWLVISNRSAKSLFTLPGDSFPVLEHLFIQVRDNTAQPLLTWDIPITAFSLSSHLRTVCFHSAPLIDPHILQLPWSQLTTLFIQCKPQTADACVTVLLSCTSLQVLFIESYLLDGSPAVSHIRRGPFHLQHLEKFTISFNAQCPKDILFLLVLKQPSLRYLHLMQNYKGPSSTFPWWSLPAFTALLTSISSSLELFEISDAVGRLVSTHQLQRNVESLIACIPSVNVVQLSKTFPLLPSTMALIGTGALLPRVEHFELAAQDPSTAIEMLTIRQATALATSDSEQPVSRLRKVEIRCSQEVPLEMLSRLRLEGLEIMTRTS
jgi:hypothetical protein